MDATPQQLDALRALQEADRQRVQAELAITKLPQPAQAAEIRKKLEEVVKKIAQVQKLQNEVNTAIVRFTTEDEGLIAKQEATQNKIEEAQGDYRSVTSLSRELEGMAKRRETIAFELGKLQTRKNEIDTVLNQALQARNTLASQEAKLAAEYKSEGLSLKETILEMQTKREPLLQSLPDNLVHEYERVLKNCGGVALATIVDNSCSICRSTIDPNRKLQMLKEAPLSHCPSCGRLIIVN